MKNIHLLPTDKPSRVYLIKASNLLWLTSNDPFYMDSFGSGTQNQHIYITSDEEIKDGDWFLTKGGVFKCTLVTEFIWRNNFDKFPSMKIDCKKIILTTDQDLIKDNVQAIDDEFLEWFVKNPSCDSVEVISEVKCFDNRGWCVGGIHFNTDYEKTIYYTNLKEQPKEDKIMKRFISNAKQQETIKEVAKNILIKKGLSDGDFILSDTFVKVIESMIEIAKETENRKQGYSEDDLKEAFKQSRQYLIFEKGMPPLYESFKDWFEEFKKKSL